MKIFTSLIGILLLLSSCEQRAYNVTQYGHTLSQLTCYEDLIREITEEEEIWNHLVERRAQKLRGDGDPISVHNDYRLISPEEFEDVLSDNWKLNCLERLKERNDLRGLRIPKEGMLIIDVDEIRRRTFGT